MKLRHTLLLTLCFVFVFAGSIPLMSQNATGKKPALYFNRNNGLMAMGGVSVRKPVNVGETLGELTWRGIASTSGSNSYIKSASIRAIVTDIPGTEEISSNMVFLTGQTEPVIRMTLTDLGRLGINTYEPDQILTVSDELGLLPALRFDQTTGSGRDIEIYSVAASGDLRFRLGANGANNALTDHLTLMNTGQLGVGTTTPGELLTISDEEGNNAPTLRWENPNNGNHAYEAHLNGDGHLMFRGDGGNQLNVIFQNGGNVGIGTNAPGSLLTLADANNAVPALRFERGNDYELNINADGDLLFNGEANGDDPKMVATNDGLLGVGTTNPSALLNLSDETGQNPMLRFSRNTGADNFSIRLRSDNNLGIASNIGVDRVLITQDGEVGIGTITPDAGELLTLSSSSEAIMEFRRVGGNSFEIANDNDLRIRDNESDSSFVIIKNNGKVGIGTESTPNSVGAPAQNIQNYRLFVRGGILTEEVRVRINWADHVFQDDYELMPLEEVENHILENGHLHNTLPGKVIESQGLELSANATYQQEKIEELFLHMIEMNKQLKALQEENEQLKSRIQALESK